MDRTTSPSLSRILWAPVMLAGVSLLTSVADAGTPRITWRMQSAFGSTVPHAGPSALSFVQSVSELSGGQFTIRFYEPGALVPPLECFTAVSKGSIESCWTTAGYHAGKIPALAFFTNVPFGPRVGEFLAWKMFGGGNELRDRIYAEHNLKALDSFCTGPETSGWFRQPVRNLEDLKGLKMRFFGFGAQVMQKMGVSTQLLAVADIYPALERGVIDATEFGSPTVDINLGFYRVAKYNYYPGWHQPSSCHELLMNAGAYRGLPAPYRRMVEVSARSQVLTTYAETLALNPSAMNELVTRHGVTNLRWPDETLAKFESAWLEVLAENSRRDPLFKEIADSYLAFRSAYRPWADAQALKDSYLR